VIVLLILRAFAWGPILKALKDREDTIQGSLDAAAKTQEEIAQLKASNEESIRVAFQERERILREAKELGELEIAKAKKTATAEADKIKADARVAIEAEKSAAFNEIKSVVAEMSIDIAQKLVTVELSDTKKQQALVEGLLKDVHLS
jgi:F-type H+-transporting ATPase subunit b